MLKAELDSGLEYPAVAGGIAGVARLQEKMPGRKERIAGKGPGVCTVKDKFQFIGLFNYHFSVIHKSVFGRESYPINISADGASAVGLDGQKFSGLMESVGESIIHKQRGLAASQHYEIGRVLRDSLHDFGGREANRTRMVGIAKRATQVTPRKTHKYSRTTAPITFALEGVEDFVYGIRHYIVESLSRA